MQQWEYIELNNVPNLEGLGLQGWELCATAPGIWIFKRPIGPDWKARCEAAEAVISTHQLDDRIKTLAQSVSWSEWQNIKNKQP